MLKVPPFGKSTDSPDILSASGGGAQETGCLGGHYVCMKRFVQRVARLLIGLPLLESVRRACIICEGDQLRVRFYVVNVLVVREVLLRVAALLNWFLCGA